ncbi:AVEN regulator, partial [Erithacus rubecula]|nr:AVEN regulator [Erithacus rubecula]
QAEEDDDTESWHEEEKEEVKCYSRRKVFSNWSRYEDTEKEGQCEAGESQRGTDFSVLLSSAGDSFTQFRFADEKEWDKESICHKQFSALSIDCQSLVQALQELPLHLRLNVAAELVQESTPLEIPQIKSKIFEDGKKRQQFFRQSLAQSETGLVSHPVGNSIARQSFQSIHPLPNQDTDHLDEELDLLLNLEAPINTENKPASSAFSCSIPTEENSKTDCKENEPLKVDMPEEKSTSSQQQQSASKDVTEEELEDWLDSMIA